MSENSRRAVDLVTQKTAKKKGKKSTKASAQPGVLGSLRSTRPERIGGDRRRRTSATTALADEAARETPAKPSAAKAAPTKAETKAAKAKPKPAKAKAVKKAKPKAAKAKPKAAKAKPEPAKAAKVKPVKRVVPKPAPTSRPQPPLESDDGSPRGTEIVTTAVQAAGELAQIGVTVGGQILRRAARRLPRR
jgi:hypothetical protein